MSKKNKQVILSVTNDLVTDQRVHKVAATLQKAGFLPLLVGRQKKTSKKLTPRNYETHRFRLWFNSGPAFYANYNIRLLFFLLAKKATIYVANDLDTLAATYFAYRIKKLFGNKNLKLIYDSHELFTEVPELNGRVFAKKTWLLIEKLILPKIKHAYTVCQSIADYYYKKYGVKMEVIYNYPLCENSMSKTPEPSIKLPDNKKVILYQGALNIGRGIEHIINIIDKVDEAVFVIAGKGDIEQELKKLVEEKKLNDRVVFAGAIPLEKLSALTEKVDLGIVLQDDLSLSYQYVLPNRLFDFMKAEIPILASDLPEIRKIIDKEKTGLLIKGFKPDELIEKIRELLWNENLINEIKKNLYECSKQYCWEIQEEKLIKSYLNQVNQKN